MSPLGEVTAMTPAEGKQAALQQQKDDAAKVVTVPAARRLPANPSSASPPITPLAASSPG